MPPTSARDATIARVRKLAKLTVANGATEHEAIAAAKVLARLMSEHSLSQSEVDIRTDAAQCIKDEFIELGTRAGEWTGTCLQIGKLFSTKCWISRRREDLLGLGGDLDDLTCVVYFGLSTDVAASIAMSAIVHNAIAGQAEQVKGANKRKSFQLGMVDRLNERLRSMIGDAKQAEQRASRNALVVLKDQLVTAEFAKLGMNLRTSYRRAERLDAGAFARGRQAGAGVDLGRGISGGQRAISNHS